MYDNDIIQGILSQYALLHINYLWSLWIQWWHLCCLRNPSVNYFLNLYKAVWVEKIRSTFENILMKKSIKTSNLKKRC